jgi:putative FmdB family regulatory protein
MPLYEYQCDGCAHRFELIQKFSDPPADACPKCGGSVSKLLSSPAIQFKGTGWYITDYARSGRADGSAAPKGEGSGSTPAGEAKESKAEPKTDAKPTAPTTSD